jgi:hypothetical protein
MPSRRHVLAFGLLGAFVALPAACGDDAATTSTAASVATTAAPPTTPGAPTTTAASPTTTASPATATSPPTTVAPATTIAGTLVEIVYRGGKIEGGGRKPVPRGQTLTVRVSSDVADEVHVHGYDKTFQVPAGGTAEVSFVANVSGVFEVELHKKHLKIADLEVK